MRGHKYLCMAAVPIPFYPTIHNRFHILNQEKPNLTLRWLGVAHFGDFGEKSGNGELQLFDLDLYEGNHLNVCAFNQKGNAKNLFNADGAQYLQSEVSLLTVFALLRSRGESGVFHINFLVDLSIGGQLSDLQHC